MNKHIVGCKVCSKAIYRQGEVLSPNEKFLCCKHRDWKEPISLLKRIARKLNKLIDIVMAALYIPGHK